MPPEPFFAGPGIDRADALRSRPEAIADLLASGAARAMTWSDGAPALDELGRLIWSEVGGDEPLFLGLDDDGPRFSALPPGEAGPDTRTLLALLNERDAPLFAAALSLGSWHRRHLFCSVCGAPSDVFRGGWARRCRRCNAEHYPRVDPVVIMLATFNDRLLLGRQPQYPTGRYSALAGFVEPGETIEAAVARELGEEAGIEVTDVSYIASQPWPFPSSLMIGCTARALDDSLTIDRQELDDARWFTREEVSAALSGQADAPFLPPPRFAIARTLLDEWLAQA